jgi:hypothetical protein
MGRGISETTVSRMGEEKGPGDEAGAEVGRAFWSVSRRRSTS